jgi:hypothetical protein
MLRVLGNLAFCSAITSRAFKPEISNIAAENQEIKHLQ